MSMDYEPVIGLEVHVQLKTESKLFCGCSTEFGATPNTNICVVCTSQPGSLPVLNRKAIEYSIKSALALNCKINKQSIFARKNYFYPDLPKNYQISQYESPLAENGYLKINSSKTVKIKRVHLEEDAGKLLHAIGSRELKFSLVDFNRTGIPLLEIVSEPDIDSPEQAYLYLNTLKLILQYTGVSDCDMEKGSLRCDANVSVHPVGSDILGTKTELKNMNSFKAIADALDYEIKRQNNLLTTGQTIIQETLLWNVDKGITEPMRTKEQAHDYRYFPEPDLVPLVFDDDFIGKIKNSIGELPAHFKERLITEYGLSEYDAGVIIQEKSLANYYENTLKNLPVKKDTQLPKLVSNWITTELLGRLNKSKISIDNSPVSPQNLAKLILLIKNGTISTKLAKSVFNEMFEKSCEPEIIVQEKGLVQITDEGQIQEIVRQVMNENQKIVNEYKSGKESAFGALVGAVMKKTGGKANPQIVNKILKQNLT